MVSQTEHLCPSEIQMPMLETLTPRAMELGGGAFGQGSGHEGGALMMELESPLALPPHADTARTQEADTPSASALTLAFAPQICGKYISVVREPFCLWCLPSASSRARQVGH